MYMYYTARAKTRSTPTDPNLSVQASGSRTGATPSLTDELYGVLSPEQRSSETSLRNNTFQIITLLYYPPISNFISTAYGGLLAETETNRLHVT